MRRAVSIAIVLLTATASYAQRMASDFEIARMREQIASSSDFTAQLSGRLNLGDLYLSRNDPTAAASEYQRALELANKERMTARSESDITGYSTVTAYAGLAQAKLGRGPESLALLEESIRFASDSAKTWNIYASAMTLLERPGKGVSAARNAVSIARKDLEKTPTTEARLDLAIYQHALATALIDLGMDREAETLLTEVIASLGSTGFDAVRREVEGSETFEIYSTARGEAAAYLSLLNRAQLRVAALQEKRGDVAAATSTYRRVLDQRSDDPTALAAFARLAPRTEQAQWFAAAFDANPFALPLIRAYQAHIATHGAPTIDSTGTGASVRRAIHEIAAGETRAARATLDALLVRFPTNETLRRLKTELDAPAEAPRFLSGAGSGTVEANGDILRQVIGSNARLTPEQRTSLDAATFRGVANFPAAVAGATGQTILESGTIDGVPFRFAEPTAFLGTFAANTPLRLTFRILGVTEANGRDALLLEPLGIEVVQ